MSLLVAIATLRSQLRLTADQNHNVDMMLLHRGASVTYRYLCRLSDAHAASAA